MQSLRGQMSKVLTLTNYIYCWLHFYTRCKKCEKGSLLLNTNKYNYTIENDDL
jgi:hypothetical protein